MQTKKDEIRKTILEAAQKEFLIHGYEGASMRTIAKKANTTLGNIYHYYENKEAILEELMREPVEKVKKMTIWSKKNTNMLFFVKHLFERLHASHQGWEKDMSDIIHLNLIHIENF